MGNVLAIHWTPTTHGTWLHGDVRGSWLNGQLIGADAFLERESRARMRGDAVVLSTAEQSLVAEVFGTTVIEKGHHVLAATVQSTHCHLIFAPPVEKIDSVVARLKYRSASAVLKRRREDPTQRVGLSVPRSLWTVGKFVTLISSWSHLHNAVRYVQRHNERDGLPANPYEWITPLAEWIPQFPTQRVGL